MHEIREATAARAGPATGPALFRLWEHRDGHRDQPDVAWLADGVGGRHLLVGRHALVRDILADPDTFRPDNALDAMTPIPVAAMRILVRHGFRLPPTLANNGTSTHPGIRARVAEALHPLRVAAQRPWLTGLVRRRVTGIAARLRAGEPVDLYAELAADLPLLVLARMVALPAAHAATVKRFSRAALELFWAPVDEARQRYLAEVVGEFQAVLRRFAATGPGLVARLRADGLTADQVAAALFFLLVAGQETTSQFLTLLLHRLVLSPTGGSADSVVEEGLRLDPPIETWRRVAARDTVLSGQSVPAGTSVVLWLARAGRDPAVTPSPDEFVPGQPGSRRHLAFGAGAHRCVGATLARMEATVVVEEVAPLLRRVQVLESPWYSHNLSFRLPDTLVVGLVQRP